MRESARIVTVSSTQSNPAIAGQITNKHSNDNHSDSSIFLSCEEDGDGEDSSLDQLSCQDKSKSYQDRMENPDKRSCDEEIICQNDEDGEDSLRDYQAIRAKGMPSIKMRNTFDESVLGTDCKDESKVVDESREDTDNDTETHPSSSIPRILEFQYGQSSIINTNSGFVENVIIGIEDHEEELVRTDDSKKVKTETVSFIPHLVQVCDLEPTKTDQHRNDENKSTKTTHVIDTQKHRRLSADIKSYRAILNISNEREHYLRNRKDEIEKAKKRTLLYSRQMLLLGADGMYGWEAKSSDGLKPYKSPSRRRPDSKRKRVRDKAKKLPESDPLPSQVDKSKSHCSIVKTRKLLDLEDRREINTILNEERKRRLYTKVQQAETKVIVRKKASNTSVQKTKKRSDFDLESKQEMSERMRKERYMRFCERAQFKLKQNKSRQVAASPVKGPPAIASPTSSSTASSDLKSNSVRRTSQEAQVHDRLYQLSISQQQKGKERRDAIVNSHKKRKKRASQPKISAARGAEMYYRGIERLQIKREALLARKNTNRPWV